MDVRRRRRTRTRTPEEREANLIRREEEIRREDRRRTILSGEQINNGSSSFSWIPSLLYFNNEIKIGDSIDFEYDYYNDEELVESMMRYLYKTQTDVTPALLCLVFHDFLIQAGCPYYPVTTGRSNSLVSFPEIAAFDIPSPNDDLSKTITLFASRGFTSASSRDGNDNIMYIGGAEITQPNFFYNGTVVGHCLEGFISPFCDIERMTPLSFPSPQSDNRTNPRLINTLPSPAIMRLMIKDDMFRLHTTGFSVLNDPAIFSGGHAYRNNFRFHIVPNRLLTSADLMRLPTGTTLPTMDHSGDSLIITNGGSRGGQMRINYVRIKTPDVVYNLKIAVQSVLLPFPHLHSATVEFRGMEALALYMILPLRLVILLCLRQKGLCR
ncbi:hypothetical protein AQUCO_01100289v1 [Aquilegia coerulea]|uniref:Plant heme peroxidase family profile domain-containing protein n=1 Tax=Aquilegia coerulea TaxID=218851 RepID=A0A2G5E6H8_AQUCA|nr:hypothetical protein AQUCO_01100289v1 [Aquilegia coerulea]